MVSCAFVANDNVGAGFAQPTRDSRGRYGSHVGCYHRANIWAALAVLSQGASRVPRMLCPRIGVAHGHVSCGLLSRSDSSLEDGREPRGTDKTEQLIMSRTGSGQEGYGMMFACALVLETA